MHGFQKREIEQLERRWGLALWTHAYNVDLLREVREKFFDEAAHPRDEHGRWTDSGGGDDSGPTTFVSPNVSNLTFAQAVTALNSPGQAKLGRVASFIDGKLGVKAQNYPAIGAWSDGAENSMMVVARGASLAQVRAASAMKGYVADQKAVLVFNPSAPGDAELGQYLLHFDVASDVNQLHDKLLSDGLAFHTLQPLGGDRYRVHVYASDQATVDAVAKSAEGFKADVIAVPGQGEFLGTSKDTGSDREQRDDALRVYQQTIEEISASGELQNLARTWDEVRDHWRTVSAEEKALITAQWAVAKATALALLSKFDGDFDEAKHPRGQPENAGQFGPGGGGSEGAAKPATGQAAPQQPVKPTTIAIDAGKPLDLGKSTAISPQEKKSIEKYQSKNGFKKFNNPLRAGKPPDGDAERLSAVIAKHSIAKETVVYRGLGKTVSKQLADALENKGPGFVFTEMGFLSTSRSRGAAATFSNQLFVLKIPAGYNALPMAAAKGMGGEAEILLDRGTKFTVRSVKPGVTKGSRIFEVEIVP